MKNIGEHFLKIGKSAGDSGGPPIRPRKKSKGIKRQSDKRKVLDAEYSRLRKTFLKENPRCMVFPHLQATQVHHKRHRGKYYLDVSTWAPVSNEGHAKIHNNPAWAIEQGLLIYR